MPVKTSEQLHNFAFEIFRALGAPVRNAELVARLLVKANLVGHDSHGIIRIQVRRKRHEGVPEGWIIDGDGRPTTDVEDYFRGGALLPLGGTVGHKGFGLGLIVDILGGALTGSGCSSSPEYKGGNGVVMGAVDISRFTEPETFVARVDELLRKIRSSRKAPGAKEILIPGELESREEARRLKDGIYVEDETWSELADLGRSLGLKVPN